MHKMLSKYLINPYNIPVGGGASIIISGSEDFVTLIMAFYYLV